MSKFIDFTKIGGYPSAQEDLGYLQSAYTEMIQALGAALSNTAGPAIINGCIGSTTIGIGSVTNSLSSGWIIYQGNLVRVVASSATCGPSYVPYLQIAMTDYTLPFNNATSPGVIMESTASLVAMPVGTADSATLFLLSELVPGVGGVYAKVATAIGNITANTTNIAANTANILTLIAEVASLLIIPAWTLFVTANVGTGWSMSTTGVPRYTKDVNGRVSIEGALIVTGVTVSNFLNIPAAYAPSQIIYRTVAAYISDGRGNYFSSIPITIDATGAFNYLSFGGHATIVSLYLDNLSWLTL